MTVWLMRLNPALGLFTLVQALTLPVGDVAAQVSVPSLSPGDRLRVHEEPPESVRSLPTRADADDAGFEARLDRVVGDTLILSPFQPGAPVRRVSLSDVGRLQVQRSKSDYRVLWGLGYGTATGAFLGYGGKEEEGDEFLAGMTAWGAAVGLATGALAKSDSRGKNALWGLVAGALVTGAVALAAGCDYQCGSTPVLVGLGAGVGSGIGALIPPRQSSWSTVELSTGGGGSE